jgi:hypothetical protein
MTKREKYEAFIATIQNETFRAYVDLDAQDNAFPNGIEAGRECDQWRCAFETAVAIVEDPKAYGYNA